MSYEKIDRISLIVSTYLLTLTDSTYLKFEIRRGNFICYSLCEKIRKLCFAWKRNIHTQLRILTDITIIDYPWKLYRYILLYNFLTILYNFRIYLKTFINDSTPVSSVDTVYQAANWYEREIWDMSGIFFYNSIDSRRILTDYGFEGFPLRKEYPLTGYTEIRYDYGYRRIIQEPLELGQEFRETVFRDSWVIS